MQQALAIHPDSRSDAVAAIVADAARTRPAGLVLRYELRGDPAKIVMPRTTAPVRRDELWRHTCFEAFVRPHGSNAYVEFNFSPSTEWAAYGFDGYRAGMKALDSLQALRIEVDADAACCALAVTLDLAGILPGQSAWCVGLSAVIEEAGGRKSWWALAHPPGKPDFHHADCFAMMLPAPSRP